MLNDEDIKDLKSYLCDKGTLETERLHNLRDKLELACDYIEFQESTKNMQIEFQKKIEELNKKESD